MTILASLVGGAIADVIGFFMGAATGSIRPSHLLRIYGDFFARPVGFLAGALAAGWPRGLVGNDSAVDSNHTQ